MIIKTANLASLFTSYNAAFQGAFANAETDWEKCASLVPSSSEMNMYAFLGQFPKLRHWVGDRVIKNMAAHDYSVTNLSFESTVGVLRTKMEDDVQGVFTPLFAEMGYAAKLHPDELVFAALAAGATNLCYDGQAFFDASHPTVVDGAASTSSNYTAAGGGNLWALMDTRHPIKPLIWQKRKEYNFQQFNKPTDEHVFKTNEFLYGVDGRGAAAYGLWQMAYGSHGTVNSTNFEAHVTAMMQYKSDEDKPLGIKPNLLVCGPSNWAAARNLIKTPILASGATNPNFDMVDILVSPHLT